MMKKLFNKIFGRKIENDWFADFQMEDGRTGRVYDVMEVDAVESAAYEAGHKAIYWSVCGGEWFNSWEPAKN